MKILITGVTSRMIGSTRLRYDYLSNVSLIKKALELGGHEVEVRKVPLTEEGVTTQYDVALVGLAHAYSLGAGYYPEATNVLAQFGPRAGLYCDDWACVGLGETLRGTLRGWERYLRWRNFPHKAYYLEQMREVIGDITLGSGDDKGTHCRWPMLLPIFEWGDVRKFMEGNLQFDGQDLVGFDPSSLYITPQFSPIEYRKREKKWVLAVLQNHDQWVKKLGIQWPIESLGNKRKGEQVLPEKEVVQLYANNWGVLAPKYPKAGTGWWRVRYVHAADTRSIMLCDLEDGKKIGRSFTVPVGQIELMGLKDLAQLAYDQHQEFYARVPQPQEVSKRVCEFVERLR